MNQLGTLAHKGPQSYEENFVIQNNICKYFEYAVNKKGALSDSLFEYRLLIISQESW